MLAARPLPSRSPCSMRSVPGRCSPWSGRRRPSWSSRPAHAPAATCSCGICELRAMDGGDAAAVGVRPPSSGRPPPPLAPAHAIAGFILVPAIAVAGRALSLLVCWRPSGEFPGLRRRSSRSIASPSMSRWRRSARRSRARAPTCWSSARTPIPAGSRSASGDAPSSSRRATSTMSRSPAIISASTPATRCTSPAAASARLSGSWIRPSSPASTVRPSSGSITSARSTSGATAIASSSSPAAAASPRAAPTARRCRPRG